MNGYEVIKECTHEEKVTRVLESTATCEKTAEYCTKCKKQTSDPKIEC